MYILKNITFRHWLLILFAHLSIYNTVKLNIIEEQI